MKREKVKASNSIVIHIAEQHWSRLDLVSMASLSLSPRKIRCMPGKQIVVLFSE